MIIFKKLRFKNFLSFGNNFTELDFQQNENTLIVGKNGVGKSTFLDALIFVLYGKPFRKINKPQLVNSINSGDCLVEIDFQIGQNEYQVRRGIKPGVFEIYEDGELLNQDSSIGDYQSLLEDSILKMNYMTFTQIVVLGKATYIPFMRLPAGKRRELIEELLSLSIFSGMKDVLKSKVTDLLKRKDKHTLTETLITEKLRLKKEHATSLSEDKNLRLLEIQSDIESNTHLVEKLQNTVADLSNDISELTEQMLDETVLHSKKQKFEKYKIKIQTKIEETETNIRVFSECDECPTCNQVTDESVKNKYLANKMENLETLGSGMDEVKEKLSEVEKDVSENLKVKTSIDKFGWEKRSLEKEIRDLVAANTKLSRRLVELQNKNDDIDVLQDEINVLSDKLIETKELLSKLQDIRLYYAEMLNLLKDTGAKALIVRKYLPIFNNLINTYLTKLGIYVTFTLDESFNEKILSRHRDSFSYNSFSEGEKLRIDLAILMAWRDISKLKNAKDTNLIIMDEIFDSSMDQSGVDAYVDLLPSFDGINVFIISHTPDKLSDKFSNLIQVVKEGNFSKIKFNSDG